MPIKTSGLKKGNNRMEIAIVLAVVAVAANILLIRHIKKNNPGQSGVFSAPDDESAVLSKGYLNTPKVKKLRESAAAELGVSMKELDQIIAKEINKTAKEQETPDLQ